MEEKILSHYAKDEDGNYLIEIKIEKEDDLFNRFDPSPYHIRDIHPSIADILEKQIIIFTDDTPVKLVIHVPSKLRKTLNPEKVIRAIRHYFEYDYLDAILHMKRRVDKGKRTFMKAGIIFFVLISTSLAIERFLPENFFLNLLSEGLFVGGWVSMWHPIETLLYEWMPLSEEKRRYNRIMNMDIEVRYYTHNRIWNPFQKS